jgi:hypothetical protein
MDGVVVALNGETSESPVIRKLPLRYGRVADDPSRTPKPRRFKIGNAHWPDSVN